jgi:hypothetical protein
LERKKQNISDFRTEKVRDLIKSFASLMYKLYFSVISPRSQNHTFTHLAMVATYQYWKGVSGGVAGIPTSDPE